MNKFIKILLLLLAVVFLSNCSGGGGSGSNGNAVSNDISLEGPFIVYVSSLLDEQRIEGLVILKEEAKLSMYGLESLDITIRITTKNGNTVVIPEEVSLTDDFITFIVPINTVDGEVAIIKDDEVLCSAPYKVYDTRKIYLTSIEPNIAKVGDSVTIEGYGFPAQVLIMSNNSDINVSANALANSVTFIVPPSFKSDSIYIKSDELVSNSLPLRIERNIDVKVVPVEELNVSHAAVGFVIGGEEYLVDINYEATIPVGNSIQQISASVEMNDGSFAHLYNAVILPDMNTVVDVNAMSTAVSWIFIGLGASSMPEAEWRPLYDKCIQNNKVQALASYIETLQKNDFISWVELSDAELKKVFQDALIDILGSIDVELTSLNTVSAVQPGYIQALSTGASTSDGVVTISPLLNEKVFVNDIEYGYISRDKLNNGSVTVVNDTRLYLSVEAVAVNAEDCMPGTEDGCIINYYKHFTDPFKLNVPSIIPPKTGLAGISTATIVNLKGTDANLEIITSGYLSTTDKPNIAKVLRLNTFMGGVVGPSMDLILEPFIGAYAPGKKHDYRSLFAAFKDIYGPSFIVDFSAFLDKGVNIPNGFETFITKPINKAATSCFSIQPGESCTNLINFIATAYGFSKDDYVKHITEMIKDSLKKHIAKRAIAGIPIGGWIVQAAIIAYDTYQVAGKVQSIGGTLSDMIANKRELEFDIDFHVGIDDVTPTCIGVSPTDEESSVYVKGEGFLILEGSEPSVYIVNEGGLKRFSTNLNIPDNEKIYATFDSQDLIDNRSVVGHLIVDHGGFFIIYDEDIRIVDEGDDKVYFDAITPDKSTARSKITLEGCGWLPLNDIRVLFQSTDGEVEAEVINSDVEEIEVKVPDNAIDGDVYVLSGNKRTKNIYFEVLDFGLLESDEATIEEHTDITLDGVNLETVNEVVFIDSDGEEQSFTVDSSKAFSGFVNVGTPDKLAIGEVRVYVIREDGLESNALVFKRLPKKVVASPDSQGFDNVLTITLTQEDGKPIFYYREGNDEENSYTRPFDINANEVSLSRGYTLVAYSKVTKNGVTYKSENSVYVYTPTSSACPYVQDTTLHGYHTGDLSYLQTADTDGDGYFDDYLLCSYYDTKNLYAEYLYENKTWHGMARTFYESGKLKFEGEYDEGKEVGEHIYKHENGVISNIGTFIDGKAEGLFTLRYESGNINAKTMYENGLLHGEHIARFDNDGNTLRRVYHYITGRYSGVYETYYVSGNMESEGVYVDSTVRYPYYASVKNGNWITYYDLPNKQIETISPYKATLEASGPTSTVYDGLYQEFYDNGNPKYERRYIDGVKNGISTEYYSSGNEKKVTPYTNGIINGTYFYYYESKWTHDSIEYVNGIKEGSYKQYWDLGLIQYDTQYKNDMRDGLEVMYRTDGAYSRTTMYKENKKDGVETYYYTDPNVRSSVTNYVNDIKEGPYSYYYISTHLQTTGAYSNDLRNGQFKTYRDSDGVLTECEVWVNGVNTVSCMP